jgi:hypothetical protein
MIDWIARPGSGMALWLALGSVPLAAKDLYVAPNGTPAGPGTVAQPFDLATALSGHAGRPGDTFWLRGGEYRLGHLNTSVQGAAGRPVTFRGVAGENPRIDGSLTIFGSAGHLVFRDFELYSSDSNRVSAQTDAGFNVTDITILPGIGCYVSDVSFINLVVHDQTRHAIYLSPESSGDLIYGCVLYNNGWVSPDNAEGHGIYAQGQSGTRTLQDNLVFNNSGANLHVYENTSGGVLRGVTLDGNVAFGAGALQHVRAYRDWILGIDLPARYADAIVVKNNMGYLAPASASTPELQIGRDSTNGTVTVTGNYMPGGIQMNNWHRAVVSGNSFGPLPPNNIVALTQTLTPLRAVWDNNSYAGDPASHDFLYNARAYTIAGWRSATRFDAHSKFVTGGLHGTKVFVRSNRYARGRANIIVYNWDNLPSVTVNVSSVLPRNWRYEVRNAQDFEGAPVVSGVFRGEHLVLPMTNLAVAAVNAPRNGPLATPATTGPTFGIFVLLSRQN